MIKNIDIDLLRSFITIHEAKTFVAAAERLERTQSTISQQIKKLEGILGKSVFIRNKRSVALSVNGEILLPYAYKMLKMNDEVINLISSSKITGSVKFGAPEAFTTTHLSDILANFSRYNPKVTLEVDCDLSYNLLEELNKNTLDFILFKRSKEMKNRGTRIWSETLIWACSEPGRFNTENSLPLILPPHPCVYREKILDALEKKK